MNPMRPVLWLTAAGLACSYSVWFWLGEYWRQLHDSKEQQCNSDNASPWP